MPVYEYICDPCRIIYETNHGMNERPEIACPACGAATERMLAAPNVIRGGHSSPTAAKYANLSRSEEIEREKALQQTYKTIWLPEPVKHGPDDD